MLWPAWLQESSGNKTASGGHRLPRVPLWPQVRAQLRENKKLKALTEWFWMILCQLWLLVTKPLLALIPQLVCNSEGLQTVRLLCNNPRDQIHIELKDFEER